MAKREGFCFRLVMNMTAVLHTLFLEGEFTQMLMSSFLCIPSMFGYYSPKLQQRGLLGLPPILLCQSFFYAVDPHSNVSIFNDKRNVPCQLGKPEIRGEKLNCTFPNEITTPASFPPPFSFLFYFFRFQNETTTNTPT